MLSLVWSETALDDLEVITDYIGRYSLPAAIRLRNDIEARVERLTEHPYMYRIGRIPETREALIHPNYLLVYKVGSDAVTIVNVMHTRREYPPADDA